MKKQHNEKVVVGDVGPSIWNRFNFLKPLSRVVYISRKKLAYALVPILLIVFCGLFYYGYIPFAVGPIHPHYFAEVGGEKINYSKYSAYLSEAKNRKLNKKDATVQYINDLKAIKYAETEHVTISRTEFDDAYNLLNGHFKRTNKNGYYFDTVAKSYAIKTKLTRVSEGFIEGAVIQVSFQQHILRSLNIPGAGNPKLIAQDRKRAEAYANDLYNRLITKKISVEDAVKESKIRADVQPPDSIAQSLVFNRSMYEQSTTILGFTGVKEQLQKLQIGQVSKPTVMQAQIQDPNDDTPVDSYYAIFAVSNRSASVTDGSKRYNQLLDTIKVKRYVP